MPSEKMSKIEFYPKRRFRGRHLLIVLLVAGIGFGIYRGMTLWPGWLKFVSPREPEVRRARPLVMLSGDELKKALAGSPLGKALEAGSVKSFQGGDQALLISNRKLVYLRSGGGAYVFRKTASGWLPGKNEKGTAAHCPASGSFHHSCVACGLPEPVISRLADIFSCTADLACDWKAGDSISVYYGKYPGGFLILGSLLEISGKEREAIGFELPDGSRGYFDARGRSLERPFAKTPLHCPRGPVLKISRPRFETMFIVSEGTRVCAVADGMVAAVHRARGARFSIQIRHGGGYSSWYGNLSACEVVRGAVVRRGMTIGRAGKNESGKAYFDFQFYRNGGPLDFETAGFSPLRSIPEAEAAAFAKTSGACMAALGRENGK